VRLLLDEHYSPTIAEKLRALGHDVVSVKERPELVGKDDHSLFLVIVTEQRAILTENWPDFHNEMRQASAAGTTHYGVLFTSPRSLPRSRGTIGRYVDVLDSFLKRHEAPDALLNSYVWLPERR